MAEAFRLDADGVRRAMDGLGLVNGELGDALGELNGVLDRCEGCWGGDEAGKQFEKGYKADADGARVAVGDVHEGVGRTVEGVDKAVSEFVGLDEDNARLFDRRLGESVRGSAGDSK